MFNCNRGQLQAMHWTPRKEGRKEECSSLLFWFAIFPVTVSHAKQVRCPPSDLCGTERNEEPIFSKLAWANSFILSNLPEYLISNLWQLLWIFYVPCWRTDQASFGIKLLIKTEFIRVLEDIWKQHNRSNLDWHSTSFSHTLFDLSLEAKQTV